ncbi:MAG: hypothetical protein MK100_05025 [Phycisphaerales bacterium]|nr:hypothetical protein [Phycisphaerales bacterium]
MFARTLAVAVLLVLAGNSGAQDVTSDNPLSPVTTSSDEVSSEGGVPEAMAQPIADEAVPADVEATDYGTFNLNARDVALTQILEMLAEVSHRNILAGSDVNATVSVNLYDVTFEEALQAVLAVGDCDAIEEGNFIYVHPKEHVQKVMEARRQRETKVFELFYLSAQDGQQIVSPLLSEGGTVTSLGDVSEGFDVSAESGGGDSWSFSARLVVTDYEEQLDTVAATLKELDVAPTQVQVEAAILLATVKENNAFGVDFSFVTSLNFTDLLAGGGLLEPVSPLSAVDNLYNGQTPTNNAIAGSGHNGGNPSNSTFSLGIIKDPFSVFLSIIDDVTDTSVLARPKVLCLNRQRAKIHVGRDVGYLTTTQTETSTTQTQEFIPTGIELAFRPFISPEGMIRMELNPSLSDASQRKVNGLNGQEVTVNDKSTHNIITNVRVRDGETIVLGGFFQEKSTITRKQVPGLGDIPLAGAMFQGQDDQIERVEIIFMLTPRIVQDEELYELGEDSLEVVDAVRLGVRSGLLPWSRDQVTANYNRDALEAYQNGDLDRALFYANASLRQNQVQPEMHRLREQMTGERWTHWERSMSERLLNRELDFTEPVEDRGSAPENTPDNRPAPMPPAQISSMSDIGALQ